MSESPAGSQGEPIYGTSYPTTYGQPQTYGQSPAYEPQTYGQPQTYGRPDTYPYGAPVSPVPQQAPGAALQPYGPAAGPVPYAQPYAVSLYFLVDSFMVFGDRQRTLHDRMANSVVRHG